MATVCQQLTITGRVQGVGYRGSMVQEARRLGVQGWVRNRRDGSVQALAAGDAAAVQALRDWARHGPPQARVEQVQASDVARPSDLPPGFDQRETV